MTTGSSIETGDAIKQEMSSKDNAVAFVAGATGRVGSRTVRYIHIPTVFPLLVNNTSINLILNAYSNYQGAFKARI